MSDSDYIFVYTRQNAIDDGVFIDVTEQAKVIGFKIPVAITTNLFSTYLKSYNEDKQKAEQETKKAVNNFLLKVRNLISVHKERESSTLLEIVVPFHSGEQVEVWVAVEAQSPTDPSQAINIMLPEDY
jgi:uncharacterized protein YuzE